MSCSDEDGSHSDVNLNFFIDRYETSYFLEMRAFIDALINKMEMPVGGKDGINAVLIADAAYSSLRENRPIKLG
ncbi:Gfo/Idh/MocA family oxidoreductase [Maribacter halichondriae]|uniref:Gfo/Idh/MocA family oxidoreductase n=1 Tax=Maribacter halichondriae TaxID=2980554 RepID=UPI003D31AA90